ncbi:Mitochondrial carrier protein ymc2 [Irineochytrium annulatum]|nr:Mitochondrial carrier protein ymc2 [Irineochytrium annulatum]
MSSDTAKELLAGCFGGIVQVLTGQPFDTVKVRLQTQPDRYTSTLDCIKKTYSNEGFLGFYKGTLTPLVGIGAWYHLEVKPQTNASNSVSVQFGALEAAKRYFNSKNAAGQALSLSQLYASGAAAGVANSVLSGPIEHVQAGAPGAQGGYAGPVDLVKKVYSQYGIAGIYKGQGITLLREIHGYGIYFATYELLMQREMKMQKKRRSEISSLHQCLYGALSGYTLWLMIYPIDVIKSKLQTDSFNPKEQKYRGVIDCARKVLATEGPAGLFRGFFPCILRAGPVNAATFVAYEAAISLLR